MERDIMTPSFDCSTLIKAKQGEAYTHEYENYLNFFHFLACSDTQIFCHNAPSCWTPFILYLGHVVVSPKDYVDVDRKAWECNLIDWVGFYNSFNDTRRAVEIASTCRPELVHALYCADTEWPCLLKDKTPGEKSFVITCNGSFFRQEIQAYRKSLQEFIPDRRKAILLPCAAAKPYPALLHREVLKRINRNHWHVITATGVLGLVPEELWPIMPHYDSGLPNLIRCSDTVRWYFTKHKYTHLVIYSDFYAPAIKRGLEEAGYFTRDGVHIEFVLGDHFRDHYENLLLDEYLQTLEESLARLGRL